MSFKFIDRIGVELEGGWESSPPGLYTDSSVEINGYDDDEENGYYDEDVRDLEK